MQIPSPHQAAELAEVKSTLETTARILDYEKVAPLVSEWEKTKLDTMPAPSHEGLLAHYEMDGNFADRSGHYQDGRILSGTPAFSDGPVAKCAHEGRPVPIEDLHDPREIEK